MLIRQTIRSLLDGVSQLPSWLRAPSQAVEQINGLSSPTHGLRKRPPTWHKARLTPFTEFYDTAFFHTVNRDDTERYHVAIVGGTIKAFDAFTGAEAPIITPHGTDYLSGGPYKAFTVGDYTFIVDTSKVVKRGTTKSPKQVYEALLFIRQADFSTTYSVTINDVTVAIRTVDMAAAASRALISTNNIAADLITDLKANTYLKQYFDFVQYGSTIWLARKDGKDFTITTEDGLADKGLRVVKGSVQSFEDLPARAKDGMVVEIAGDPDNPKDSYWVKYDDADTPGQMGVWRECPAPGTLLDLDKDSMPWALVRRGEILSGIKKSALPQAPAITKGADVTYTEPWLTDDGGFPLPPDVDVPLDGHGSGVVTRPSNGDSRKRRIAVAYDVDTTLVEQGVYTTVQLEHHDGTSWNTLRTTVYPPGKMVLNESLTYDDIVLSTTDQLRLSMLYSTGETPSSVYRRSRVVPHRVEHPYDPGMRLVVSESTQVAFDSTAMYPVGTVVSMTLTHGSDTETFQYTVTGDDQSGIQVATGLHNLVNPSSKWNSTNIGAGVILVSHTSGEDPQVTVGAILDPNTTFYNKELNMVPGEHVGRVIFNESDGSSGTIVANGVTTIVVDQLTGGADNQFTARDVCHIQGGTSQYFVLTPIDWKKRAAGDDTGIPFPSFVDRTINEVFFYQNRLGFTSGENIVMSAAGDLFRFFRATAQQVLDDDPIDIKSAHKDVATFDHALVWDQTLFLFSGAGHQFVLSGEPALAPRTVRLDHVGSFPMSQYVRPLSFGTSVLFPRKKSDYTQLIEFFKRNTDVYDGADLTQSVPQYLEGSPLDIAGDAALGFLAVLTDGGAQDTLYIYTFHDEDNTRVMSSWSKWTFGGAKILAIDMFDGLLAFIMKRSDGIYLEHLNVGVLPDPSDGHRDRRGYNSEEQVPYTFRYRLNTIYQRDGRTGEADAHARLQLAYLTVYYHDTQDFRVEVTPAGRPTVSTVFSSETASEGALRVPVLCRNTDATIEIVSDGLRGCAFSSIDWEGTYTTRSRRV